MLSSFLSEFGALLIGVGFGQVIRWQMLTPGRRHFGASVIETFSLALAISSAELVFRVFPQLKEGWRHYPTLAVAIAAVWFPGSCLADWVRGRTIRDC
jgi:hypothetical protein